MWSTLLISLDILVCIALIFVVLMQRSEGGAFGMGGGPTGLVTARGAGDLLTRITWSLFAAFLTISLTLTLIGAHDRSTSSVIEKLKLQRANTSELNQPVTPPTQAPGAPVSGAPVGPTPGSLVGGSQAPLSAPAPQPIAIPPQSVLTPAAPKPRRAAAAASSQAAPAPPVLEAPPPKPEPAKPASDAPASGAP
jgi:preprotein translocase subunit SecG